MAKNNVTFITSYLKIYPSEYDESKTFEKRLRLFMKMVGLGIDICVFTSPEFADTFKDIAYRYDNVCLLEILEIDDLLFTRIGRTGGLQLPEHRSHIKDLPNYMFLMLAKTEFMKKAIDANPFDHTVFCWLDFSLPYVFRNEAESLLEIQRHARRKYIDQPFLTMPGCWASPFGHMEFLKNQICWRFCGGFFMGDHRTLLDFYEVSIAHFTRFLHLMEFNIVWEVNYWAWLEHEGYIHPLWYPADHNDTIVDIPSSLYVNVLMHEADNIVTYNYPRIFIEDNDRFFPSSAAYIYDHRAQKHVLNTRFVNYRYRDNWDCDFFNESRQIRTMNLKTILNDEFEPVAHEIMRNVEAPTLTPNPFAFAVGLEDIRLFDAGDHVGFIASNLHYVPANKIQMIVGDYDHQANVCKDMHLVEMSWDSKCEKNWAPLRHSFVYKWSPYMVGHIQTDDAGTRFVLDIERTYTDPVVNRFRGSTPFLPYGDGIHWIGVVHFSEPNVPPVYYHSLVLIDETTLLPVRFSAPFKFAMCPIEFCVGFTMKGDHYLFWISQMDRDPALLFVTKDKVPIDQPIY